MPRPESLFHIFGVILILLTSISVINFTTRSIFGSEKSKEIGPHCPIYDPDSDLNSTLICPFERKPYRVQSERTVCFNRTLHYRYIPWIRFDVWRDFRETREEKKRRRTRKLEIMEVEERKENYTKPENSTSETGFPPEASLNRKVKEEPSKVICTILAAFLILSSLVAFCDVLKEKCMPKIKRTRRAGSGANAVNNTDPLLGGERKEIFHLAATVAQNSVIQSSLDRLLTRLNSEVKANALRCSSASSGSFEFGILPIEENSTFQDAPGERQMSDFQESLNIRRRSRRNIRRY